MKNRIAIFPGSFDPLTFGHLDLIERASRLFDKVIVLVATNTAKQSLFIPNVRQQFVANAVQHFPNVSVEHLTDELVMQYAKQVGATVLIRGVRNTVDFEYEYSIANANRQLNPQLETVLLYADERYRHLSSSLIKEIAKFGGDISQMVPPEVGQALHLHYKRDTKAEQL